MNLGINSQSLEKYNFQKFCKNFIINSSFIILNSSLKKGGLFQPFFNNKNSKEIV